MVILNIFHHAIRELLYIGSFVAVEHFIRFVVAHSLSALVVHQITLEVVRFDYLSLPICAGGKGVCVHLDGRISYFCFPRISRSRSHALTYT